MCVQLTRDESGVLISVRLKPRGRKNAITEIRNGVLQIEVAAPPVENAANAALLRVLADALGCAKGDLEIARGEKSRDKTVRVLALHENEIAARLNEFKETNYASLHNFNRHRGAAGSRQRRYRPDHSQAVFEAH